MGNQQTKTKDITADQYAEYMKLKQEQEYKKQIEIAKMRETVRHQVVNNKRIPTNFVQMPQEPIVNGNNMNMLLNEKSNKRINDRNEMNNRGINNNMINSLKNPIGETTIENKALGNNNLYDRYTSSINNYHHFDRMDPTNSLVDNPKDTKDNFMDKVDIMSNDRMFENTSSENNYYPRMIHPEFTEKVDQSRMEETYQDFCNGRQDNDPVQTKSDNKKPSINHQTNRRDTYLKKIKEVSDPFKLIGITRNDDLVTAKQSYKKLALKLHPDRGGDPKAFSLLTKAFLSVTEELKAKEQHNHNDMKKDFDQYGTDNSMPKGGGKKLNIKLFNDIYEKNKLFDPYDSGYNDWINKNPLTDDEPKELFSNGFNIDIFNKVFQDKTQDEEDYDDTQVIKYGAPTPQLDTTISYTELGIDKVGDFSKMGGNENGELGYTDYRRAHSKSKLIDINKYGRKEYKNINDLEAERERITYDLKDEDALKLEKVAELQEREEYDRQMKQREHDIAIGNQFKTVNQQYLGQ